MARLVPGLLTLALLTAGCLSNTQSASAVAPNASDMLVFVCQDEAENSDLSKVESQYMMNPVKAIKELVYIFDRSTGNGYEWNGTEKAMVRWRPIAFDSTVSVHTSSLSRDGKTILSKGIEYDYSSGDMMIESEYLETIRISTNARTITYKNNSEPEETYACVRLPFPEGIKIKAD